MSYRRLPGTPVIRLPALAVSAKYVDSLNGDNANDGSIGFPWETLAYSYSQIAAGETLYLRDSDVFNEAGLTLSASGTSGNEIRVEAYPGESPIIDGSIQALKSAAAWEVVDVGKHLYRTVASNYDTDFVSGSFIANTGDRYALISYMDESADSSYGLSDIQAAEFNVVAAPNPRYVGPGIFNNAGQIYCRLEMFDSTVLHDSRLSAFSTQEVTTVAADLTINTAYRLMTISGSHISIGHGIAFRGAHIAVELANNADNIEFDDGLVQTAYGVSGGDGAGNADCKIINSRHENRIGPWLAWTDIKGADGQTKPAQHWINRPVLVTGGDWTDVEIAYNHLERTLDGFSGSAIGMKFHHNTGEVLDDTVQLGTASENVEINANTIDGSGFSHNGNGASADPGTVYVFGNVIDGSVEMLWGKNDPGNILRTVYREWRGSRPIPSHNTIPAQGNPWKIYHNTFINGIGNASYDGGQKMIDQKNTTGIKHEVYNNIMIDDSSHDEGPMYRNVDSRVANQEYDGNIYWFANAAYRIWSGVIDSGGSSANFTTLAAFRAGSVGVATGWDAGSYDTDPELDASFIPSATSDAKGNAIALPGGWPTTDLENPGLAGDIGAKQAA